jgi:phosphoglycerol transferase MdoB-like AlkP superfamily enzyme
MKQWQKVPRLVQWALWTGLVFLVLFTILRIALYFFSGRQGYQFGELWDVFFLGLRYDLRMVSILVMVMLLFGSISLLHPFRSNRAKTGWMIVLWIATVVTLFLFIADFAHYAYLSQRLNASVLNYLDDAAISMSMVWQTYPVIWMLLGIAVVAFLIMWIVRIIYRRIARSKDHVPMRSRIANFIAVFFVTGFLIFGKFDQYPLRWSDAFALGDDYKANLAFNPFQSFFSTLKFRHSNFDPKRLEALYPVLKNYYRFDRQENNQINFERRVSKMPDTAGMIKKPNIVLVICESFSAYKSSLYGNPLNTTPFFDSLSQKGLLFDRCFTPTYGTARGVWATITGTPDVAMPKTASRNPSAVDQHTIMNDFEGYEKLYFLGGSTSWANIRGLLTNNIHGLKLYEQEDYDAPKIDVWGISDKNLFLEANKVLSKQTQPFFAIIQTADNHRPYTIPEEDLGEFKKTEVPADSLKKFGFESLAEFNAFRYTDFCFRKFMEAATRENYASNTLFVFIGDHGIPGDAGNLFPRAWTDQRLTMEHVPLLFYAPEFLYARRSDIICSQVDVMPTIASICNIPYTNTTLGRDMMVLNDSGFAFIFDPDNNMAGVIKGDYFYRKRLNGQQEVIVSIINNEKLAQNDSLRTELRTLTDALYESSRYLLLNNKKKLHVKQ